MAQSLKDRRSESARGDSKSKSPPKEFPSSHTSFTKHKGIKEYDQSDNSMTRMNDTSQGTSNAKEASPNTLRKGKKAKSQLTLELNAEQQEEVFRKFI